MNCLKIRLYVDTRCPGSVNAVESGNTREEGLCSLIHSRSQQLATTSLGNASGLIDTSGVLLQYCRDREPDGTLMSGTHFERDVISPMACD